MKNLSALIAEIEYKTNKLIEQNKELKQSIYTLENENSSLLAKFESQTKAFNVFIEENKYKNIADEIKQNNDTGEVKRSINNFIREINKCIALLNE